MYDILSCNLPVLRAKADIAQAELAAVDLSRQTSNAIERGRYDPNLELAFELAAFFDCRIEDIITYSPETE